MSGAGYDYECSTYATDGRVFQVEYAQKAVDSKGSVIGVRCVDGVVLGVEKLLHSDMLIKGSAGNRLVHTIDRHVGAAFAGIPADARALAQHARKEATDYRNDTGESVTGRVLAKRVQLKVHEHTRYVWNRTFGCAALFASYDSVHGPELHLVEPNAQSLRYFATAVGKHKQAAKTQLEKIDFSTITCAEAVKLVAAIIYKNHDDVKDRKFELELSWVCDASNKLHVQVPQEVYDQAVREAEAAKAAAADAAMQDDE
ncbi:MAG: hypothetical protein MHM6MM_007217 [Cercozoa sp. M6MM]